MVTLEQLLLSRDRRAVRQSDWVRENPDGVLVCLTVILPGAVKRDGRSLKVARAAVKAVRERLSPVKEECLDLETGFEGYFIVPGELLDVKRACCAIEDNHPFGRLMDLDALEESGGMVSPVSRDRVGMEPRRCLVCGRPARECMRSRKHSGEELLRKIDELLGDSNKS